jgi:tetratricopeptide (TPR) repeat protein
METPSKAVLAQKRKQKRLIWSALAAIALIGGGWYAYDYVASAPLRAKKQFDLGMHSMAPGAYPEAVAEFTRAISIWPEYADAYLNRGIAEHNLLEMDSAAADLDKASELNSNLTRAYDERGRMYLEKGDTRHAIEEFSKSIRVQPTTDGYYQRGLAYQSIGEHQKAVADYDQAIAQQRDAPYAYRARALSRDALGDTEGAKSDRESAQSLEFR